MDALTATPAAAGAINRSSFISFCFSETNGRHSEQRHCEEMCHKDLFFFRGGHFLLDRSLNAPWKHQLHNSKSSFQQSIITNYSSLTLIFPAMVPNFMSSNIFNSSQNISAATGWTGMTFGGSHTRPEFTSRLTPSVTSRSLNITIWFRPGAAG